MLGWRTMLQLLARRAAESNAFSVPDRNALWSRAEDDLLVQAVAKHSTSDVLFPDWSEVATELPGRSKQQCKERYRLADTMVELTFVFLRISVGRVRCAPACVSTDSRSKGSDTAYASPPSPSSLSTVPRARPPPPRSRMYTGTSVLATQPGRGCLLCEIDVSKCV